MGEKTPGETTTKPRLVSSNFNEKRTEIVFKETEMKKTFLILLISLSLVCCNKAVKHAQILEVYQHNLEVQSEITELFNERNIPLQIISNEARLNKYNIDKTKFRLVDSLTNNLKQKLISNIAKINSQQKSTEDKTFNNATLKYCRTIQDFEISVKSFFESVKDSIKNNEKEISLVTKRKAGEVVSAIDAWNIAKVAYENNNSITQKEINTAENLFK